MKRSALRFIAALGLGLTGLINTAFAQNARLVELNVRDLESYAQLPRYYSQGQTYVPGVPGNRFAVEMRNLTGQRVLAVLSVDGVNAISGQTAGTSQAGYVLEPWQSIEVKGWRKSYSDIAEFYFTDLPDSYAARTGRPQNVGVIGVAAFRERGRQSNGYYYDDRQYDEHAPRDRYERERAQNGSPAPAAPTAKAESRRAQGAADAAAQEIGTGHGNRRYDPVTRTYFERESSRPNQVVRLYYDSHEALAARGIIRQRPHWHHQRPEAFPTGFVPDPRW
jgi:hypothetical protein